MQAFGLQFIEAQMLAVFAVYDANLKGGICYDEFNRAMQGGNDSQNDSQMQNTPWGASTTAAERSAKIEKYRQAKVAGEVPCVTRKTVPTFADKTNVSAHNAKSCSDNKNACELRCERSLSFDPVTGTCTLQRGGRSSGLLANTAH